MPDESMQNISGNLNISNQSVAGAVWNSQNASLSVTPGGFISIGPSQYSQQLGGWSTTGAVTTTSTGTMQWTPIPEEKDEIKSKPGVEDKDGHNIQCRFRVESYKVVCEYFCNHCDSVLFSKVICKIPKKITKAKCLPKLLKGV